MRGRAKGSSEAESRREEGKAQARANLRSSTQACDSPVARSTQREHSPRSEYERVWKDYRLDEYSRAWATLKALRICLHCLTSLPARTDDKRQYCQAAGRNAAR